MKLTDFLQQTDLEKTFLIGYYGGGNYGDELLLEVLQNIFAQRGLKKITIPYQRPEKFSVMHHDFGYKRVLMHDKVAVLKAMLKNKNILIGGGGLWGLDMNFNTFLLSVFLFMGRRLFGKRVYLVGVGYYNSTTKLGHFGAWLAAKGANVIYARDQESFESFKKLNKNTRQDVDIAWSIPQISLDGYKKDAEEFRKKITVKKDTIFIALRHFKSRHKNNYAEVIEKFLDDNQDKNIIVSLLEAKEVDKDSYANIEKWRKKYSNIQYIDFLANPLGLYYFLEENKQDIRIVAPQFHMIITAHLIGIPFLPVVYDNKVRHMLNQIGVNDDEQIAITAITPQDITTFINQTKGDKR